MNKHTIILRLGLFATVTVSATYSFANDPTTETWLPAGATDRMRLLAYCYNGSKLMATRAFANGKLKASGSQWICAMRETPIEDGREITATFRLIDGTAPSAGVAAAFDFADWSTNNDVLIHASVYNGNRNSIVNRGYASGFDQSELSTDSLFEGQRYLIAA